MTTRPAPQPAAARRRPGRPRRVDVEGRVLDAAIALLAERGLEGTTTSAVIRRSGVARATVFLRWPTHAALIADAIRRAMGRPVLDASGDVEADIRRGAEQVRAIFSSRTFQAAFPAIVAGLTGQVAGDSRLSFDVLAPGRPILATEYQELAVSQGLRLDVAPSLVIDALVGALIGRYLATDAPPSEEEGDQIVEVILDGLRVRSGAPS